MNKATVLVVMILVSVAFSAQVLANGYEESHEHAECDSQPDGWLDSETEESRTGHEERGGHESREERVEAPPGQEGVITPPAVPVTPPTPVEEPLSDEEFVVVILTAAITAGVFGKDEIKDVISALREWNLSGRPNGIAGLGDLIFREKPAETVTTQHVSTTPAEKPEVKEKPTVLMQQEYVEKKIKGDPEYNAATEEVHKARWAVHEARNNVLKHKRELNEFANLTDTMYKGPQLPEYEERVKEAEEALAAAWRAQNAALRALHDKRQDLQHFYRGEYETKFGHLK